MSTKQEAKRVGPEWGVPKLNGYICALALKKII